jgi:hypothetical protein
VELRIFVSQRLNERTLGSQAINKDLKEFSPYKRGDELSERETSISNRSLNDNFNGTFDIDN